MKIKETLYQQLISIAIVICGIVFISLGLLLPRLMLPIYEKNIYQYLNQPLDFIQSDFKTVELDDVAYLYVTNESIIVSENLTSIIELQPKQILDKTNDGCSKFNELGKTYYYCRKDSQHVSRISVTNNDYNLENRKHLLKILLPILILTLLVAIGLVVIWAQKLITKIELLKKKIDNLDNDDYVDDYDYNTIDELSVLAEAIDKMKATLKKQEEYKNQMYQNISHDFKTPLTVIKSHIEALEDGMLDSKEGFDIIKEQVNKLEMKVHSLLYLNKLNYIQELEGNKYERVNVKEIIDSSISKFKMGRPDVTFTISSFGKTTFNGTYDMWEAIIDNLLNNFVRYAKSEIKITIRNNKIIFYNDGPKIDSNILDSLFSPYTKGMKGQFGLGLSIVKKSLTLLGYEINVQNEKQGVSFIIK